MSDDCFEWEMQPDKLAIEVCLCIFMLGLNEDGIMEKQCAFIDENDEVRLPFVFLDKNQHVAQTVLNLIEENVSDDYRNLDIMSVSFFDPVINKKSFDVSNRSIILAYKTIIAPGTPIKKNLRFYNYEKVETVKGRIRRGHFEAFRRGFSE